MVSQIRQVAITYLTHRWLVAIVAVWLLLLVAPQLTLVRLRSTTPRDTAPLLVMILGLPLFFAPAMLVAQAKEQFAHSRRVLVPNFVASHLTVVAGLLATVVLLYPLLVAWCCRLDTLGTTALALAIATPTVWAMHRNRVLIAIVPGILAFHSTLTSAGIDWWLIDSSSHRLIHSAITLVCVVALSAWLWRLSHLREEMEDYLATVQWRAARRGALEVAEQRRGVAEQMRRNPVAAWIMDAWLSRIGGFHGNDRLRLARLLRFGYAQPAEISAICAAVMFFGTFYFLAKYTYVADTWDKSDLGPVQFLWVFATMFPGVIAGEPLAQRRPRIASELLRPLTRGRLIDGLLWATAWNVAVMFVAMNAVLWLLMWLVRRDEFTVETLGTMLLLGGGVALAVVGVMLRTAVWTSNVKRLAALGVIAIISQVPLASWSLARYKIGDLPFAAAAIVIAAVGVVAIYRARIAWMNAELG